MVKKRIVIEKHLNCKYGVITYRLPTASEIFGLLSEMKIDLKTFDKDKGLDQKVALKLMAQAVDLLDPFITNVDVEIDGEKHTDAEFVLSHPAFLQPLSVIANEFMALLNGDSPKKNEPLT